MLGTFFLYEFWEEMNKFSRVKRMKDDISFSPSSTNIIPTSSPQDRGNSEKFTVYTPVSKILILR